MRDLLEKLDAILSETDLDDLKDHPAADDPKIKKAIDDKEKEQENQTDTKKNSNKPQLGDAFDISLSKDYNIESFIVEATDDAVVIELDQTAIDYLEQNGARLSEETHGNSKIYDKCWKGYKKVPGKKRGEKGSCVKEAEYQGRKVTLNKPTRGDVKKFKVYVKDPSTGNVKKVNFGDPDMKIKKSNPERRKSFRARHNCDNPGPKTKARYWSCRAW